ncbi:phenylacetate--CoA ligase family protein [bacterium]|nr:phenylacetate--CoA ligase family protein [bacterium]MBU1957262.1 phenylacetate--CoA ligase family protein [bacterium]
MLLIYRLKFYFGLSIINFGILKAYYSLTKTNKLTLKELEELQNNKLRQIINYSYYNIPYYKKTFDSKNIKPSDIYTVKDLYKLPILTKSDIRKNIDDFYPIHKNNIQYSNASTGGSTGEPLKYRVSKFSSEMSFAILLRGWGLGGYKLGDKVVIIAGGSLVGRDISLKSKIVDYVLNFRSYSSYGVNDTLLKQYTDDMIEWNPKYIRGYASAIFLLAEYVYKNNLESKFNIKGVFTTSEMLLDKQREFISKVFTSDVFDTYGLNDGAITAFECQTHQGKHIDMERGLLEVVDDDGHCIYNQEGYILATTLMEYSMPLIRYDTGDIGILSDEKCSCSIERPLLKELKGRVTDTLKLNGILIASPIITVLMGKTNVLQYQFIQIEHNKLKIKILKSKNYTDEDEVFIIESLTSHVGNIVIEFEYVNMFSIEDDKKHKFIINMIDEKC